MVAWLSVEEGEREGGRGRRRKALVELIELVLIVGSLSELHRINS